MATIDELISAMAGRDGVLLCRWHDNADENRYNAYINGGTIGETVYPGNSEGYVHLRRFVIWLNADNTVSSEICYIDALDGDAYWERMPQLLREDPEPSVFETKLAAKIKSLIGDGSATVRTKVDELDVVDTFAIARVFSIDGANIKMVRYFAYLDGTGVIRAKPYVEA